jgi:MYXO-CTERM domain-containing protein
MMTNLATSVRYRVTSLLAAGLVLTLGATAARAADPFAARYSHDASAIFWLMHLSDTHIGASIIEGPNAIPQFEFALGEAYAVIDPVVVINTGDLCDGSLSAIPAFGQDEAEWIDYRTVIDAAGMTTDIFIDIPGNHDAYGENSAGELIHYLIWSLNGSTFGTTTRSMVLDFPFGRYLLYGTSTPNAGSPPFIESPEFSLDEVFELDAVLTSNATATLALVFGHHPVGSPGNSGLVIDLLQQHQAFWFHGHRHDYGSYAAHYLYNAEVDTLGKGNIDNIAVIAVDNNALSYAATDVDDPWPFVVITTPANRRMDSGDENPYAYQVCNTATDNPVRALVFDASPVSEVSFSVAGAAAVPMTPDPVEPRLWHGTWDTTGLAAGETTLTVTATANNTRSREVHVMLADVTCPTVQPQPDAGVADAGPADAEPDAAVSEDASALTPDAGDPPGANDGGCGCRAAPPPIGLLPLLLVLGLLLRRST